MATVTTPIFNTPGWVDLMSADPEGARAFYQALFGWTYRISGPEFGFYTMADVGDRPAAGMGGIPEGVTMPSVWSVYFLVEDIQAAAQQVAELGGVVTQGPFPVGASGHMAIATDNTGAVFGLWQPGEHRGMGVAAEPGALAWTEVNTRDMGMASAFYQNLFGMAGEKVEGMDYVILSQGGVQSCGVLQMTAEWGDLPPHWMVYFNVANTDEAVARAQDAGGKLHHGPFDTPHGRMAVLSDPAGAVFSVIS